MSEKRSPPDLVDCLIVGGGPAGQGAAVTIGRNVHTAVVFDSRSYRNERSLIHMMPTWDSKDPHDFREAAKKNTLDNFDTIFFEDLKIEKAAKKEDIFELTDENGKVWRGRTLILANGIVDLPMDIPGFDECWGRSIFHCLFCHGYEQRGSESSGVFATPGYPPGIVALHYAHNSAQLTKKVTIYSNGDAAAADEIRDAIGSGPSPFSVDNRRVTRFVSGPNHKGITLHFEDGSTKDEAFVSYHAVQGPKSGFLAEQLGLDTTQVKNIKVQPPFWETSVRGCFAAGDNSTMPQSVSTAVSSGVNTGVGAADYIQSLKHGHKSFGESLPKLLAMHSK